MRFKFDRSTPRSGGRCIPLDSHLVVKNGKFGRFLLSLAHISRSTGRSTPLVLTSCGQDEFKFGRSTPRTARRSPTSKDFRGAEHSGKVVKMSSNLADLPLDLAGRCIPLLRSSGQEWQFQVSIVTDEYQAYPLADLSPVLTSCWQDDPFIPRTPEIPTSTSSGVLNTMAKVWKL